MVDVEQRNFLEPELLELSHQLRLDLLAGLAVDLARLLVEDILGEIAAVELLVGDEQLLQALVGELLRQARGELAAGLNHDLAGLGIDHVGGRLDATHAFRAERHAPTVLGRLQRHLVIEGGEDLLVAEAQRIQQRCHRQLAAPVDAHKDDVLGVELEVEPGAAIGNDARGEQQLARRMGLAAVVIEEHARRTMHLRDNDALGAVDDESAVHRHERHVAHVDILFLDVLDGARAGLLVHIEDDETERDLQRRGKGHAPLLALFDVVFRLLEGVAHEFQLRAIAEILDRKHRTEDRLQALVAAPALRLLHHEELVIGLLLDLDEVRHFGNFVNLAEHLPQSLTTIQSLLRHGGIRSSLGS